MLIIGERINTSRKPVNEAVANRDAKYIQADVTSQMDAGADLVDINAGRAPESMSQALVRRLKALGYLGEGATTSDTAADFVHTNSIAYDANLDQILLSVPNLHEIWVIDHSSTTAEAAGHSGGNAGKAGTAMASGLLDSMNGWLPVTGWLNVAVRVVVIIGIVGSGMVVGSKPVPWSRTAM